MSGLWELFLRGGPIMWPILLLSIVTGGVVLERLLFFMTALRESDPKAVEQLFSAVEHGKITEAIRIGQRSRDGIARTLAHGLEHREISLSNALIQGAGRDLDRLNRGLVVLDTAVTLGPLLGLLGTVVGMIHAFGVLGGEDLAGKTGAITGGIAESLIAVTFGLGVAIVAIVPLNYLTARLEKRRRELEDATNHLELLIGSLAKKQEPEKTFAGQEF